MVPAIMATTDEELQTFSVLTEEEQPSYTYALDLADKQVQGYVDGIEAMRQAIFKILQTERYDFPNVYSSNYGVELKELIGQPIAWVLPEAKRRITEALLWDSRITNVDNFKFNVVGSKVLVTFDVDTIFGDLQLETEVAI